MAYRGHVLKEFDLDGALTRHPALALVDELAHSNAPGSRHAKRWQDIEEMLAAGIDVWTTLNVQHLDSLNEAVGSITGVRVWETVPDEVFDGADEVILVDLSADELLRRLKEGKVYLPEQARHATRNFFRKGNLIALRELALRRTADHVDDDVQAYRRDRAIEPVWRTREAVVACIGADEDAEYVIRSAHRLSQQLECDLHVVTVDTRAPRRAAKRPGAAAARDGACRHAGRARRDAGRRRHGRRHGPLRAPPQHHQGRRRPHPRQRPAAVAAVGVRPAQRGPVAGLAVAPPQLRRHAGRRLPGDRRDPAGRAAAARQRGAGTRSADPGPARAPGGGRTRQPPLAGYAWALCYCAIATALSALAFPALHQTNIVMLFLLAVVAVAVRHGRGPAALASVVSVGLFDFSSCSRWRPSRCRTCSTC